MTRRAEGISGLAPDTPDVGGITKTPAPWGSGESTTLGSPNAMVCTESEARPLPPPPTALAKPPPCTPPPCSGEPVSGKGDATTPSMPGTTGTLLAPPVLLRPVIVPSTLTTVPSCRK